MEGKVKNLPRPDQVSWSVDKNQAPRIDVASLCILHGSEVALFYEMLITRARSNVIGVARLCTKYVNTASEVKFHVQSGIDETKNKAWSMERSSLP